MFVAYELRTGTVGLQMPFASYRGPEGQQSQSEGGWGALSLAPESMSHYIAAFPGADLGGGLHLELFDEEGWEQSTIVVPTTE